jgi:hypothetical protein
MKYFDQEEQERLRRRFENEALVTLTCVVLAGVLLAAWWIGGR